MKQLKSFGAFWYDFIVGDDWHVAALVVAGLALTAVLAHVAKVNAWWLLPLVAFAALAWSLHRATAAEVKPVDPAKSGIAPRPSGPRPPAPIRVSPVAGDGHCAAAVGARDAGYGAEEADRELGLDRSRPSRPARPGRRSPPGWSATISASVVVDVVRAAPSSQARPPGRAPSATRRRYSGRRSASEL